MSLDFMPSGLPQSSIVGQRNTQGIDVEGLDADLAEILITRQPPRVRTHQQKQAPLAYSEASSSRTPIATTPEQVSAHYQGLTFSDAKL